MVVRWGGGDLCLCLLGGLVFRWGRHGVLACIGDGLWVAVGAMVYLGSALAVNECSYAYA